MKPNQLNSFNKGVCPSDEVLQLYAHRKLNDATLIEIEKHASNCEICSDIISGLEIYSHDELNIAINSLHQKIDAHAPSAKIVNMRPWDKRLVNIAATITLLAISTWVLVKTFSSQQADQLAIKQESAPTNDTKQLIPVDSQMVPVAPGNQAVVGGTKNLAEDLPSKSKREPNVILNKKNLASTFENYSAPSTNDISGAAAAQENSVEEKFKTETLAKSDVPSEYENDASATTESLDFANPTSEAKDEVVTTKSVTTVATKNTQPILNPISNQPLATLFNNRNYKGVITKIEHDAKVLPIDNNYYYYGASLFYNKQYKKAITPLELALAANQFYKETEWLLAQSYYKNKEYRKAKPLLQEIVTAEGKYKEDAKKLLANLD
ncbi:MAG: hypothetical protein RIQ89_120 [Bacteroidota bacterium]|jgi:tetratricopeptide (TPR) repeat protein